MNAVGMLRGSPPIRRRWIALGLPIAVVIGIVVSLAGPTAVVLTLGAVIALAATVFAPGAVLALYLLIPFYKGAVESLVPVDLTVVLALLNGLQVVPLVLNPHSRSIARVGIGVWLSVGLMVLAGVIYAPDQQLALGQAVGYWALVVMPILPAAFRVGAEARHLRQLFWVMAAAASGVVVLGVAQVSTNQRLVVLGMNTIQVSRIALLVPVLGATLLVADRRLPVRIAALVLMPPAILVALASGSRGPIIVLALMAIAGIGRAFVSRSAITGRRLMIVGAAVAATVAVLAVVPTLVPALSLERFTLLWDFLGSILSGDNAVSSADTSAGARARLFGLAITMFQDRPLIGAGTAGFQALSPVYVGLVAADAYPHNALLQFAAEFGIVGVTIFLGLVAAAMLRPLPPGTIATSLKALGMFFLLNAMLSGNIIQDRMTWALLLLLLVVDVRQLGGGAADSVGRARHVA